MLVKPGCNRQAQITRRVRDRVPDGFRCPSAHVVRASGGRAYRLCCTSRTVVPPLLDGDDRAGGCSSTLNHRAGKHHNFATSAIPPTSFYSVVVLFL